MTNTTTLHRLAGDWMTGGYINNTNRPERFDVVMCNGQIFEADLDGSIYHPPYSDPRPLTIDADGAFLVGYDRDLPITFHPRDGELARIEISA